MITVFTTISVDPNIKSIHYKAYDSDRYLEYEGEVKNPVNAVLAKVLKKDDKVKIILLADDSKDVEKYIQDYKDELAEINKSIHAQIVYGDPVIEVFQENKLVQEKRFRKCIDQIEEGTQIICDITYGQKPMPILQLCVLSFAEKYFNADIKYVTYGSKFESGHVENPHIYNVTDLYYLHELTAAMDAPDGKTAITMLDKFFEN